MSRMPSRRASSSSPSAISFVRRGTALLAVLVAACTPKLNPPSAAIDAPGTAHVGVAVVLDGSKSAPGPSATGVALPISFQWAFTALPAGSRATLNDASLVKPSFRPDVAGTYAVQLVVNDGVFSSEAARAEIEAVDDCRPTVSVVTAAPTSPGIGEPVALTFEPGPACASAGADSRIVAWKWVVVSAPAGSAATIQNAAGARASFVPDRRGDFEIALQVTDAMGLSSDINEAAAHVSFSVKPCGDNRPAIDEFIVDPVSPNIQQAVQLGAIVSHADAVSPCALERSSTYRWSMIALPAGSHASLNDTGSRNPSFVPDVAGDYLVELVVTDNVGRASAPRHVTISTTTCGTAIPVVTAEAPATSFAGNGVQLGVHVTDADNPAADGLNSLGAASDPTATGCSIPLSFTYQWSLLAAPKASKATLNNASIANPSFVTDVAGDYIVGVVATASTGKISTRATAVITASDCGTLAPVVTLDVTAETVDGKRKVTWTPEFRIVDTAAVPPDPAVAAKIAELEKTLSAELDVEVGKTSTELDSRRPAVRGGEAAIGNLIADAMRSATGADVALTNGGGIRAN